MRISQIAIYSLLGLSIAATIMYGNYIDENNLAGGGPVNIMLIGMMLVSLVLSVRISVKSRASGKRQ